MADYLDKLNEAQRLPVLDTEGRVLVLAGAGSGKTRVLTSRIAYLVRERGVPPWEILAITFTNKAANEMRERLEQLTDTKGMWIYTIHSMCTRILRGDIEKLGYTSNFTIYAEAEKSRVLKKLFEDAKLDDEKLLKRAIWLISDCKSRNLSPDDFSVHYRDLVNVDALAEIYENYEAELKRMNALDFDDILTKTFDLFRNYPEVLQKYQEKFRYIHIDEFQDTNEIQFVIVKALAAKHGNLFAVGDDDQSIYGWRGADIRNIIDFRETFPDAKIYKLEQNYRSSKKILDAANRIIANNTQRMGKTLWTDNEEGVKIETFAGSDENQEAYYVAGQINSLIEYNGYKYSDFGVLMRVNALSRSFEQEFLKYRIPYRVFGGFKFYERREIKDVLAYLRILVNPFDDDAVRRVINVPKRGIGETTVRSLSQYSARHNTTLLQTVREIEDNGAVSAAVARKIAAFRGVVALLEEATDYYELSELIDFVIEKTGILAMYAEDSEENLNKRLNIEEFAGSVKDFCRDNPGATLAEFLQSVTLASDIDETGGEDNAVTLATVHAVKGLEFKAVFVVGLDDGIFPLSRARDSLSEMEEERRLMYVAVTRARQRLYLTRANSRYLYGRRDFTMRSQFLNELKVLPEPQVEEVLRPRERSYLPDLSGFLKKPAEKQDFKDMSAFRTGTRILHRTFGEGTILEVAGSGVSTMLTVIFKGHGVKNLSAQMAPITVLE